MCVWSIYVPDFSDLYGGFLGLVQLLIHQKERGRCGAA